MNSNCEYCDGTGIRTDGTDCRACGARGKSLPAKKEPNFDDEPVLMKKIPHARRPSVPTRKENCPECEGVDDDCTQCGGRGYIRVPIEPAVPSILVEDGKCYETKNGDVVKIGFIENDTVYGFYQTTSVKSGKTQWRPCEWSAVTGRACWIVEDDGLDLVPEKLRMNFAERTFYFYPNGRTWEPIEPGFKPVPGYIASITIKQRELKEGDHITL